MCEDKETCEGSGYGSVGRAAAYNSTGQRFKSNHQYNLYCMFTVNYIEIWKDENER